MKFDQRPLRWSGLVVATAIALIAAVWRLDPANEQELPEAVVAEQSPGAAVTNASVSTSHAAPAVSSAPVSKPTVVAPAAPATAQLDVDVVYRELYSPAPELRSAALDAIASAIDLFHARDDVYARVEELRDDVDADVADLAKLLLLQLTSLRERDQPVAATGDWPQASDGMAVPNADLATSATQVLLSSEKTAMRADEVSD